MMTSKPTFVGFLLTLGLLAVPGATLAQRIEADAERHAGDDDDDRDDERRGRDRTIVGDGTPASCTEMALRHALNVVQASGGGIIRFRCGRPVRIMLGEPAIPEAPALVIPDDTTIDGGGVVTLVGTGVAEVVFVASGSDVVLRNLNITHTGSLFPLIRNDGTLTVRNCTISDNPGGGIVNNGTLTVRHSTLAGLGFSQFGTGGIDNFGELTVRNSVFSGNEGFDAGGIFNTGTATVSHSTFFDHSSEGDGGISNGGTLTVINSHFSQNGGVFGDGAI
jgi:Right handed beta helix region